MSDNKLSSASFRYIIQKYVRLFRLKYLTVANYFQTDHGKLVAKTGKYFFQIVIFSFLLYQLSKIGWGNFFQALPSQLLFYLIFLLIYFALPFTEIFTYNLSWNISLNEGLPVFLKKRVYNKSILGYSGEVQLFTWARKKYQASDKQIFRVIRDNNIMSSLASTLVAFGLLLAFILGDQITLMHYLQERGHLVTIISVTVISLILLGVAFKYRRYFFAMPKKIALSIFGIHILRLILLNVAQIFQWHIVIPEIPLRVWFTYLSLKIVLSRIPFLPNKELIFISSSLGISSLINVSSAGLAGLLIAQGVLEKIFNICFYFIISLWEKRQKDTLKDS